VIVSCRSWARTLHGSAETGSDQPFYLLDPAELGDRAAEAATGSGAARLAPTVGLDQMRVVDFVVCGSVAVNGRGTRIGKGAGYSDIEVALLIEAGLLQDALLTTTVHPLQVVDGDLPKSVHDFRLDLIATPEQVITCETPYRPAGIYPQHLDRKKIEAIPVLASRFSEGRTTQPSLLRSSRRNARDAIGESVLNGQKRGMPCFRPAGCRSTRVPPVAATCRSTRARRIPAKTGRYGRHANVRRRRRVGRIPGCRAARSRSETR
jgi:hypothetical protein